MADANEVLVDGAPVTMFLVNAPSLIPPVDATQEFRVQTNNYAAEFGRSSGALVNASIKSGTNQLHGSLYEFLRNDKLDANDFFLNRSGQKRPALTFNQYGFAVGGPIWIPKIVNGRNKLFFFFSYEGLRNNTTNTADAWVETPQFRQLVINQRPGGVTAAVFAAQGIEPRIESVLPADCSIFGNDPNRCRVVQGGLDLRALRHTD